MQLRFFFLFSLDIERAKVNAGGLSRFHVLGEAASLFLVPLSLFPSQATISLVPLHLHEAIVQERDPSSK